MELLASITSVSSSVKIEFFSTVQVASQPSMHNQPHTKNYGRKTLPATLMVLVNILVLTLVYTQDKTKIYHNPCA